MRGFADIRCRKCVAGVAARSRSAAKGARHLRRAQSSGRNRHSRRHLNL